MVGEGRARFHLDGCIIADKMVYMARTNIHLDDDMVAEASRLTGIKTKKDLVSHALAELIRRESRKQMLMLEGRVPWKGNLTRMRQMRRGPR